MYRHNSSSTCFVVGCKTNSWNSGGVKSNDVVLIVFPLVSSKTIKKKAPYSPWFAIVLRETSFGSHGFLRETRFIRPWTQPERWLEYNKHNRRPGWRPNCIRVRWNYFVGRCERENRIRWAGEMFQMRKRRGIFLIHINRTKKTLLICANITKMPSKHV